MALRTLLSRDLKCFLCGAVSGRLVRSTETPDARPALQRTPGCPDGPRLRNGRLVCHFCGGSLFLDSSEVELEETQREYPRERRGRRPRRQAEDGLREADAGG